jgi:hypothetical protein
MNAETAQRPGGFGDTSRRSRRRGTQAGAAVLATVAVAGLLAATADARPPSGGNTVFVHSAGSGELSGGRLILRGVGRRVTWAHHSGRTGVMAVRRLHRRLFSGGKPAAIGALHVAGHRGGDELTFKLTKPRYNRARRTVSYKVKRLANGGLPGRAAAQAAAAARRFGAASLSIIGATQPSVSLTNTYQPCDDQPQYTCWLGGFHASGLPANASVTVTVPFIAPDPGDDFEYQYNLMADGNGNIDVTLSDVDGSALLCTSRLYVGSITVSGGGLNQTISTGCPKPS